MAKKKDNRKTIIIEVLAEIGRPASMKDLIQALEVPRSDKSLLKKFLYELTAGGDIVKVKGDRYAIPRKLNLIEGTISCHPDGFGFLVPTDKEKDGAEDLFIPPRKLKNAMHGDTCLARVEGVKPGGKREGSIVRITKRANSNIVGTVAKRGRAAFIIPSNSKILETIEISATDGKKVQLGTIVEVEIVNYGEGRLPPFGKVIDILGSPEDPNVEAEVILRSRNLASTFPDEVLKELNKVPAEVKEGEAEGRTDLRDMPIFTIDGETAKDFDDAVGI